MREDVVRMPSDFIVIVGAPRSGTTLLRLLLDAHSEIGSPAEAGLPALMDHLAQVWLTVEADVEPREVEDWPPPLSLEADRAIRATVGAVLDSYRRRERKRLYCDKLLDAVEHLAIVAKLFPDTKYVILVRHVMDCVASALESSPFGFAGYGYTRFVQSSPENFVSALVAHWVRHVGLALQWVETHTNECLNLRYEDLVRDPDAQLARLFAFLNVAHEPTVCTAAFAKARWAQGPGDHKIAHTKRISSESVGRGKRVPVAMIPPPLRAAANQALQSLGYETLDDDWNLSASSDVGSNGSDAVHSLTAFLEALVKRPRASRPALDLVVALVVDDLRDTRWVLDTAASSLRLELGEVDVDAVLAETLQAC